MKLFKLNFLILGFLVSSCSTSRKEIVSDFNFLRENNSGIILSVNLQTNGRIRSDKECLLKLEDSNTLFELPLTKGFGRYAIPTMIPNEKMEITELNCGPFYYYDLKNQGASFLVEDQRIKYIGQIYFDLKDTGKLEWGHKTKDEHLLQKEIEEMGIDKTKVKIELLQL